MKKFLGLACLVWAVSANAQNAQPVQPYQQSYADNTTPGVTNPLGGTFKVPRSVVPQQGRVVFYRNANVSTKKVASVYINGTYHASLQRGGYSTLCLPPVKLDVAARMQQNGLDVSDDYDIVNVLMLQGSQDVYVRISEQSNGRAVMEAVKADMALPELLKTREQQHTISRVAEAVPCLEDAVPVVKPQPQEPVFYTQNITLGADALFAFGKSGINDISDQGRRTLDHLIDRIKTEFGNADRVHMHVVGHADPFGNPESNMALSKARSATIKEYFVRGSLRADRITTDGKGSAEPIVTCSSVQSAASIDCNKPNRRVVITVKVEQKLDEMTEHKGEVQEVKPEPKPEVKLEPKPPTKVRDGEANDTQKMPQRGKPGKPVRVVRPAKANKTTAPLN
jgi:OOP family OmpA-OmpF porin